MSACMAECNQQSPILAGNRSYSPFLGPKKGFFPLNDAFFLICKCFLFDIFF